MKLLSKSLPVLQSGLFRGLGAISQVMLAWWVSRTLIKSEAGEFLFYIACFTVASPVLLFGTQQFSMRQLSEFDRIDSVAIATARALMRMHARTFALITLLGFTVAAFAVVLIGKSGGENGEWIGPVGWLAVSSILAGIPLVVASHFHGVRRLGSSIFFSHICLPAVTVLLFVLMSPQDTTSAIRCHVAGALVTTIVSLIAWRAVFSGAASEKEISFGDVFSTCRDFWFLNAFQMTMNWSPLIIAGWLLNGNELAELNVAQRAGNLINFLLIVVSFAFTPKFRFHWSRGDLTGLRRTVSRCSIYLFTVGTPVAIMVVAGSEMIMKGFGESYQGGALLLCIFAGGQYFNVITGSVNQILTMCDSERTLRNICFVSALTSCLLGFVLLRLYGAMGAAIAVALALTIQNVLAVVAVRRRLGFWVFDFRDPGNPGASGVIGS